MQVFPETEGVLRIDGPVGPIEVHGELPRGVDRGADIVVCHPHPLHGGTKDNKVVHTLARAGRDQGFAAVRFNFRGVGGSAGQHDDGRGEVDDALAVMRWLRAVRPGRRLVLAGFSFGAWVAARAAADLAAAGAAPSLLLLVAPPVQYPGFALLPPLTAPLAVLVADDDEVVSTPDIRAWVAASQPQAQLLAFPCGHFFHGQLPALKAEVERLLAPA